MKNDGGITQRWFAALSLAPVAVCAVCAFAFAYDAPYWDEWVYVEPVVKAFEDTLTLSDFAVRVNEHVYVTPSIVMIPLARLTHWNIYAEIAGILLIYAGTFGLFVAALRRTVPTGSLWAMPLIACALFSIAQHAVWNWGLHVSLAMAVLLLVIAVALLSAEHLDVMRMGSAITAGWAATFSIGSGLAVWPAGAIVLLARSFNSERTRGAALGVWLAAGAAASGVYAWLSTAKAGGIGVQVSDIPGAAVYVLAFLGGPVAAFSGVAAAVAGAGWVAACGLVLRRTEHRNVRAFAMGLGVAAFTAGVLTALKHVHEGAGNAISSRFLPWGTLAWCGLAVAVYAKWPTVRGMPRGVRAVTALVLAGVLASSGYGAYKAEERHDAFLLGRRALIEDPASADMKFIHPEPETLGARRELLIKYRLTVFRDDVE